MTSFRRRVLLRAFQFFDIIVMMFSFLLAAIPGSQLTSLPAISQFFSLRVKLHNVLLFLALLYAWHLIFSGYGLYESKRLSTRPREVVVALKATLTGTCVIGLAAVLFHIRVVSVGFLGAFWLISSLATIVSRLLLRSVLSWIRRHGRNLREILIVGTNARALEFASVVDGRPELGYRLAGFVDEEWSGASELRNTGRTVVCGLDGIPRLLRERVVDEVVLALPLQSHYPQASRIIAQCAEQGIVVRILSSIFDTRQAYASTEEFEASPVVTVHSRPVDGWPMVLKRTLDAVLSSVLLIGLAPVLLVTALLIKLTSPGPVFFGQERIGLNKRRFRIYKFRTMIVSAEREQAKLECRNESDGPVFKIHNDPRVTPLGKFLRKTSIDELPQLLNVLKGDMSLVGPRPLPVRDYEGFDHDWQRRRFSVRPGITCLWQINGRSSLSFDKWMELDMQYIDQWSLWLDVKILAKTIPAVLKGSGAA